VPAKAHAMTFESPLPWMFRVSPKLPGINGKRNQQTLLGHCTNENESRWLPCTTSAMRVDTIVVSTGDYRGVGIINPNGKR
jgi:hypothetical protein